MTPIQRAGRVEALTDALRSIDLAIGDEPPTDQTLRVIEAIKRMRDEQPGRVNSLERVDYLERVQSAAQAAWVRIREPGQSGPEHDATAGVDTPLGRLRATTWRTRWRSGRIAWASEYYLNNAAITIAEIKALGLAQRPTTRRLHGGNAR